MHAWQGLVGARLYINTSISFLHFLKRCITRSGYSITQGKEIQISGVLHKREIGRERDKEERKRGRVKLTAPQLPQLFPPSEAAPHLGQSDPCILPVLSFFPYSFLSSSSISSTCMLCCFADSLL